MITCHLLAQKTFQIAARRHVPAIPIRLETAFWTGILRNERRKDMFGSLYLPTAGHAVNMFALLGLGGGVGFLSGMFGVGGGFLMTPLLMRCVFRSWIMAISFNPKPPISVSR
jgi:hypothetical protein